MTLIIANLQNLSASWLDQLSLTGMQPDEEDAKKEKKSMVSKFILVYFT